MKVSDRCDWVGGLLWVASSSADPALSFASVTQEMNIQQLTNYRKSVMSLAEAGKLYRKDLEIVLCSEPPM